jgi:hypothetical protein
MKGLPDFEAELAAAKQGRMPPTHGYKDGEQVEISGVKFPPATEPDPHAPYVIIMVRFDVVGFCGNFGGRFVMGSRANALAAAALMQEAFALEKTPILVAVIDNQGIPILE